MPALVTTGQREDLPSYELDDRWLHRFWVSLHQRQRAVRVQVHTHAFQAFHSHTDDQWPIVHTPGFCSLVVPNFASVFDVSELFLAEIDQLGKWRERRVHELVDSPEPLEVSHEFHDRS